MAILVEIRKITEKNAVGYYKVSMGESPEFYMGIDKKQKILKFYPTQDFINPIKIIDCQNENEIVGTLPGFNSITYSRALSQALKTFDMEDFPDVLDYIA